MRGKGEDRTNAITAAFSWDSILAYLGLSRTRGRTFFKHQHLQGEVSHQLLVVIGQGEPERSAAYAEKYDLPCPVVCDPDFRAYEAYGLLGGKPSQIVYDAPEEFLRGDYEAFVQLARARREAGRPLVDSPWQLPGKFVLD